MSEKKNSDDLDKLSKRLANARDQQVEAQHKGKPRGKAMGMAYRMSYEMVIAVLVGTYIGWLLDDWFGTKPLFLIVMFFLGMAAGILNVVRTSDQMAKQDKIDAEKAAEKQNEK
jgi:ATP synthase protein I